MSSRSVRFTRNTRLLSACTVFAVLVFLAPARALGTVGIPFDPSAHPGWNIVDHILERAARTDTDGD